MPWDIVPDDIAWLIRVDEMWSVSEVIQAVLVLSFYHGKSAMVNTIFPGKKTPPSANQLFFSYPLGSCLGHLAGS